MSWSLNLKTVPGEPLLQRSYEHLKTKYKYKDWDIDEFLSLARDLSQCTKRGCGFCINDIAILSERIEEVVQQHWPDKDEDAAKSLYAQALNNLQSHRDELRRSLSKPVNDLIGKHPMQAVLKRLQYGLHGMLTNNLLLYYKIFLESWKSINACCPLQ